MALIVVAPIVACEQDSPTTPPLQLPGVNLPETGAPSTPPPATAPQDASPSTPIDAAPDAVDAGVDATVPPKCNDGTVDPGETCDPLASCPAACPQVQCQLRALENGGTCTAVCKDTALQTSCINGDGCCPPTCNATNDDDCKATCNNGAIEKGETCDPLASCPSSCPAIGCQLRTLQGGGTCTAACVNGALQTQCVNGDGCCPATCNANNDSDCGPGCGNNIIEAGETCDPLTSCPTVCPMVQCMLRKLQNGGTCQAACVDDVPQTQCVNNDGCCPSNCNANNDNDCKPACGNSVVEKGETCDPLGSCPTSCPQIACQLQKLDNPGTCQAVCSPAGFQDQCINKDGCCPKGCNANNDSDCKSVCGNNIVEPGETCDGTLKAACPAACPPEQYTCYASKGAAATCDILCHDPITSCGTSGDSCCPFDGNNGCDSTSDKDCNGGGWKVFDWPVAMDTTKGQCVPVTVFGIVAGGSYDVTTCAPPGKSTGSGDPYITNITDNVKNTYLVTNDNCTDPTALPHLAKSECKNNAGALTMACASPSPGGFIAKAGATSFSFNVCPNAGGLGTTPLYIWYNATAEPSATAK